MGRDKVMLDVAGMTMLDRTLAGVPSWVPVIAVGPEVPVARTVEFCREEPAGGGPVAAVDAGLVAVGSPVVVLLSADLPFVGVLPGALAARLGAVAADIDAVLMTDDSGRIQQLCSAYRADALRGAIAAGGVVAGASMRGVVERLRVITTDVSELGVDHHAVRDVDTPEDLAEARALLAELDE
jgi:molybdopterin-guanine dinucleotide biosynthesis protein A